MRVFHHYEKLEEYRAGMWKRIRGQARKDHIANAADLMKQPCEFRDAMLRALDEWPLSCEANLTAESVNRIAWPAAASRRLLRRNARALHGTRLTPVSRGLRTRSPTKC